MPDTKEKKSKLEAEIVWDRIQVAKKFYEKHRKSNITYWNKLWIGKHFDSNVSPQDRISVNYTYAVLKQKLAALYYQNPKIIASHRRPQTESEGAVIDNVANSRNVEMVLNWQKDEYPFKREIKKCLLDWKRSGYGVMFTGWKTDFTEKKIKKTEPRKILGIPFGQKEVESDELSIEDLQNRPDFRRMRPDQVYFSPESQDSDDIPYVVIERVVSYEELENDARFKNIKDIPADTYVSEEYRGSEVDMTDDMRRVRLYDYYDKNSWVVMAHGLNSKALYERENPYADVFGDEESLPVVLIFGDDDLDNFYPLSEIGILEPQQRELNKIRSQQINHRKRFNRKYLVDKNKITDYEKEKLTNPEDGTTISIDPQGEPLASAIFPVPDADLSYPNDVEVRIKEDINVMSGILQYQLGSSQGENFKTLGQTEIAEVHSQTRKDEEQEEVERFVEKVYKRLFQLDQKFLQESIVQRVVGNNDEAEWLKSGNADIQGEFDIKIESGSQLKNDDDVLRKQFLDTFNLFYGKPEFMPIIKELGLAILKTFPAMREVEDKLRQLPPPPPPPPEEKPVNVSITIPAEFLPPDAIGALAAKAVGQTAQPPQPPEQEGAINPELLGQGEPSQAALIRGVNQVR